MKKNKTMRLVSITLLFAMIALVLVSGTYAKYTSSFSGTDTAIVAKWDVSDGNAFDSFDLFTTVKDSDGTSVEDDVKTDRIAPGTSGAFTVELTNNSEVTADYVITVAQTNLDIPIEYSIDGVNWYKADELDTINNALKGTLAFTGSSKVSDTTPTSKNVTISWKWEYQVQDPGSNPATYDIQDAADKALATGNVSTDVKISAVFTQVD
ncbi:MAG: hypothetical protein Q4D02_03265 [Clostridia bacterium]|nr:hypothetical protein [Clostridia bacterium]